MEKLTTIELTQEQLSTLKNVFDDGKRIAIMDNRDTYGRYSNLYRVIFLQVSANKGMAIPEENSNSNFINMQTKIFASKV
jgi:hypothetical protein